MKKTPEKGQKTFYQIAQIIVTANNTKVKFSRASDLFCTFIAMMGSKIFCICLKIRSLKLLREINVFTSHSVSTIPYDSIECKYVKYVQVCEPCASVLLFCPHEELRSAYFQHGSSNRFKKALLSGSEIMALAFYGLARFTAYLWLKEAHYSLFPWLCYVNGPVKIWSKCVIAGPWSQNFIWYWA